MPDHLLLPFSRQKLKNKEYMNVARLMKHTFGWCSVRPTSHKKTMLFIKCILSSIGASLQEKYRGRYLYYKSGTACVSLWAVIGSVQFSPLEKLYSTRVPLVGYWKLQVTNVSSGPYHMDPSAWRVLNVSHRWQRWNVYTIICSALCGLCSVSHLFVLCQLNLFKKISKLSLLYQSLEVSMLNLPLPYQSICNQILLYHCTSYEKYFSPTPVRPTALTFTILSTIFSAAHRLSPTM